MQINLGETFCESKKFFEGLIATSMTTAEAERCFSNLQRFKTFLRNSMSEDRLNVLSMLSIEEKMVPNFNEKVIDKFVTQKIRRNGLIYKK